MKIYYYVILMTILIVLCGCKKQQCAQPLCTCPETTICLQPLDDYSQAEAKALKSKLEKELPEMLSANITIKVMPAKKLPLSLLNDNQTRFRADKVVRWLNAGTKKGCTTIGLTHHDVSVPRHGSKDWGVMGLALQPSSACVVSTFRVKDRTQLWKVATHEFIHAFYDYPHCPKDDPHCIMQDAKGKNPLKRETGLCKYCSERLG